ncbi:MAG: hypothetical protein ACPG4J_02635, partial [Lentibacter algarum]
VALTLRSFAVPKTFLASDPSPSMFSPIRSFYLVARHLLAPVICASYNGVEQIACLGLKAM